MRKPGSPADTCRPRCCFTAVYPVPAGPFGVRQPVRYLHGQRQRAVVGLDNFVRLFADNVFWQSLLNNLLYIPADGGPRRDAGPAAGRRAERKPPR